MKGLERVEAKGWILSSPENLYRCLHFAHHYQFQRIYRIPLVHMAAPGMGLCCAGTCFESLRIFWKIRGHRTDDCERNGKGNLKEGMILKTRIHSGKLPMDGCQINLGRLIAQCNDWKSLG